MTIDLSPSKEELVDLSVDKSRSVIWRVISSKFFLKEKLIDFERLKINLAPVIDIKDIQSLSSRVA
jgi:hypothetical protein